MNLEEVKLVTHKECSDGSACAILFVAAGGKQENIVFCTPNYSETDETAKSLYYDWDGPIWFVDVSVSLQTAEILSHRDDIVILDHHASAIPLSKYTFCEIEEHNARCGSKMFYDFLRKNCSAKLTRYKEFIDMVDDIDRWIRQIDGSEIIHNLHSVYNQKLFIKRFLKNPSMNLTSAENLLLEIDREKQNEYVQRKKQEVFVVNKKYLDRTINVGFVNAGGPYRSLLGDAICTDANSAIDLIVMINGEYISLRSRGDVDCSKIAELNYGGGHRGASGLNFARVLGKSLIDLALENIRFE